MKETLPMNRISRRKFLQVVGLTAGAVGLRQVMSNLGLTPPSTYEGPLALQGSGQGRRVIILGAGLAGLVTAFEMSQLGYDCHILEARDRTGGRCLTIRAGTAVTENEGQEQTSDFAPGQFFNAGPDRIPQEHRGILAYCRQFGLPVRAFVSLNTAAYYFHENVGPLSEQKIRLRQAYVDLQGHTLELLARAVHQNGFETELTESDRELLSGYLESYGHLEEADDDEEGKIDEEDDVDGRLVYEGAGGAGYETPPGAGFQEGEVLEPLELSALLQSEFWRHFPFDLDYYQQMALLHLDGGMDQIVRAFEQQVGHLIQLEAEVQEIGRTADGVRVVYLNRQTGEVQEISGDYCVCTIPLPVLAGIANDFPTAVQNAIAEITYLPATKVGLQFSQRFWEDDEHIYGGSTYTNLDIGQIGYPSWGYHGERGIIQGAYNLGPTAVAFANLAPAARIEQALAQGSRIHPQYQQAFETGFSVAWHRVPYSLGAWAVYTPEQRQALYPLLNQFDDFIYLAGDHMSYLNGWMEGAILSAHHTIRQIHERVQSG